MRPRGLVLERIVARTHADLLERMTARPLESLEADLVPSDRSFEDALRRSRTGFILECKKASPSRGLLRPDFDPARLATSYAWAADAISVLTDAPFFQGSHAYLRQVRDAVPLPVLCKDFVVDPYQVTEARAFGADAILLMLSVVDDTTYRVCHAVADGLNVDVLTEVHNGDELRRAIDLGAKIVGINNRDLSTLEVDLGTTERLAPKVPADRVKVCESGVFTHADVRELRPFVDAFLIGTSLVRERDVDRATRKLVGGRFKVCGLTRPEDAVAAWNAGATWGGLIFAPRSPRCVDLATAKAVRAAAPLSAVGVFVDADPAFVAETTREVNLRAVQLHGDESPEYIRDLRPRLGEQVIVWKAIRVRDRIPPVAETGADCLVLDAHAEGQRGGTGQRFDWSLLEAYPDRAEVILGGGLSPKNAAEADRLGAWALDVNSGVESAPGQKDAAKLEAFAAALRGRGRV